MSIAFGSTDGVADIVIFSLPLGTVLGIMQWLILRRKVYQAGWWILANTVAYIVFLHDLDIGFVSLFVFLVMPCGVMTWLLRHPRSPM